MAPPHWGPGKSLILLALCLVCLAACISANSAPDTGEQPDPVRYSPTSTATPFQPAPPDPTATPLAIQEFTFPPQIELKPLAALDRQITYLTHAGDGSGRLFVVGRRGRIWIIQDGEVLPVPFLDIAERVDSASWEQGLLSIAFDPDYAVTGEFYVYYTNLETDNDTVVARYRVSENPDIAAADSGEQILFVEQPANNHNGGQLQFGPDGYLYIGLGDGGKGGDPWGNAQNRLVLLGKILRLDVRGQAAYTIPPENPYANDSEYRPEIWAYGLRNPWRFSFDRLTGDLFIADVGEKVWEEINFQPAGSSGGENYGWDILEGTHCYEPPGDCNPAGTIPPIAEYEHTDSCSVTGGYRYRGTRYARLEGVFFYADFCSGVIWGMHRSESDEWQQAQLLDTDLAITSFGEDQDGELYVLDLEGGVFRLIAAGQE